MILATLRRRAVGALTCVMLAASPAIAVERVYFIAAEEVAWDYAPSGRDLMMDMDFDEDQQVFVASSAAATVCSDAARIAMPSKVKRTSSARGVGASVMVAILENADEGGAAILRVGRTSANAARR